MIHDFKLIITEHLKWQWKVAQQWRFAEGVWIPKEDNTKNIKQYRTISLLSIEGRIFFAILSRQLTEFLLKNDTSVQKGGIPKVPGCLEHTGVVTQLIRKAREGKTYLWTEPRLNLSNPSEPWKHLWLHPEGRCIHLGHKLGAGGVADRLWQQWASPVCLVNPRPGFTSTVFSPGCCGPCLCTSSQ